MKIRILTKKKKIFSSAINLDLGEIEPIFATDYGSFFYLLNQARSPYAAILDLANNIYEKISGTQALMAANIPHIRFPGSPWFSIVDLQKNAVKLTVTKVNVHEAENRPIQAQDKKVILLYAHKEFDIPIGSAHSEVMVPLVIRGKSMPAIVSLVAGNAEHYLEEIDAREMLISDVVSKFAGLGVSDMAYDRTFYIKKLIIKNNLNSIAKNRLNADDRPILEFNDVIINQQSFNIKRGGTPVGVRFTYKGQRFAIDAMLEGTGLQGGLGGILQSFWIDLKSSKILDEVKIILDKFLKVTAERTKSYPYPLKKVFTLSEVAKAEKARAQFPALIKQYKAIQNDPDAVAKWLKKLTPGQRAAMQDYMEYTRHAAQEATQELQRSLAILSVNLTALNNALTA